MDITEIGLQELSARALAKMPEGLNHYASSVKNLMSILKEYLVKKIDIASVSFLVDIILNIAQEAVRKTIDTGSTIVGGGKAAPTK